jgi:hypothetical protein
MIKYDSKIDTHSTINGTIYSKCNFAAKSCSFSSNFNVTSLSFLYLGSFYKYSFVAYKNQNRTVGSNILYGDYLKIYYKYLIKDILE